MTEFIAPLQNLMDHFRRLPGIGGKTAIRLAFSVMELPEQEAEDFAAAILAAKREIHLCRECCNVSTEDVCPICADEGRDHSTVIHAVKKIEKMLVNDKNVHNLVASVAAKVEK